MCAVRLLPGPLPAPLWYCGGAVSDERSGDAYGGSEGGTAAKRSPIDSEDHGADMLSGDEPSTSVMPRPPLSLLWPVAFSVVTSPIVLLLSLKEPGSEASGAFELRLSLLVRRRL